MIAPERLRDVTITTNRTVPSHYQVEILDGNFMPLDEFSFGALQRGFVIGPIDFVERLAAILARLASIPTPQHSANQTLWRRHIELCQAFLSAILVKGPVQAISQMDVWWAGERGQRGMHGVDLDHRRFSRARAGDYP